jgi:DNA-binding transcriptional LysR family regulator
MKPLLDLNLLPVMDAMVSEGSVSGAAELLGITQSAVSHALRRLRAHFNDPLFVRSGNRMLPTPRLQALEPFVRSTMEGLRIHLDPAFEFDPARASRSFTLSATDMGEAVFLPAIIRELRARAPRCRLRVVPVKPRDVSAALQRGEIDLAIGGQRLTAEGLYQQQLLRLNLVCICSARFYPDLSRLRAGTFAALPHLAINPYGQDEDLYDWAFQERGIQRRFVVTAHSFLAIPLLVRDSDLVATVPESLPAHFEGLHSLATVEPPVELPQVLMRQAWHPRYHTDPAIVWLRHTIFSLFSGRPAILGSPGV